MAEAPESFGAGLAARSRPRMAATARLRRSGSIGAVGRSTLGFGRIIATAGSARPTVTPDVLTTRSLRPPLGAWSASGVDDTDGTDGDAPTPWTTSAMPTRGPARRSTPAPSTAPSAPAARHQPAARPASKGAGKGTGKVDALRRLLESRGMIEPSEPSEPAEPSPDATPAGDRTATGTTARDTVAGDRTATSAGADTAPGRFGRRVRPEPTAPESPLASVFPDGGPSPTVRRSAKPSGSNDLDGFRRALEARGMMPSDAATPSRESTPPAAPRSPRPRASERSTPSRPESPRGVDGDADGERAPAAPSRSLPFALAPETSPASTPRHLRRSIDPAVVTASATSGDARRPGGVDATVGSPIAPGVATFGPNPAGSVVGPHETSAPTASPGTARSVTDATRRPTPPSPATPARPATSAPPATPASPTTSAPPAGSPSAVASTTPRSRTNVRRVELRRLAHRIGLDRTLTTVATAESAAPRSSRAASAAPPSVLPSSPGAVSLGPSSGVPAATRPAAHSSAVTSTSTTSPSTETGPTAATIDARVAPPTGTIGSGDRRTEPVRRSPDRTATAPVGTRAPIVVTRASEARTATRNVRHRMARRRFAGAAPGADAASPTDRVAPGLAVAGATAVTAPSERPTSRRAPSPEPTVSRSSIGGERPYSAVAAGPGALRRALRSDAETAPPSPPSGFSSTPPSVGSPQVPATTTPAPVARSTDPSTQATPAAPAAPMRDAERPAVPDPGGLAATTADRLTTPAPTGPTPIDTTRRDELGERFLRELGREPDRGSRELPAPYRPLATAITGSARPVRVSSDRVSRQALETVGKEAVTVGDTIHVVRPPSGDARTTEVLAHELVHVAHPSPVPRFFDDDHRGPEERMAEQVAQVIARSPVMPSSPVPSNRAGGSGSGSDVVRRSPAPRRSAAASGSSGAVSAAALADALEGRSAGTVSSGGGSSDTVRRAADASIRRSSRSNNDDMQSEAYDDAGQLFGSGTREERDRFDALLERSIDRVVRRVEERVIAELERRGGRYWRNF